MQVKIFTIPLLDGEEINEEMNRFLRGNKVIEVEKHLVTQEQGGFWTFCVTYTNGTAHFAASFPEKKERIDYKAVLDENAFSVFTKLRFIRKQIAESDAVPAYAVFTDAELAEISKLEIISETNLKSIQGIGAKKAEKYGVALCTLWNEQLNGNETERIFD